MPCKYKFAQQIGEIQLDGETLPILNGTGAPDRLGIGRALDELRGTTGADRAVVVTYRESDNPNPLVDGMYMWTAPREGQTHSKLLRLGDRGDRRERALQETSHYSYKALNATGRRATAMRALCKATNMCNNYGFAAKYYGEHAALRGKLVRGWRCREPSPETRRELWQFELTEPGKLEPVGVIDMWTEPADQPHDLQACKLIVREL